jgi:hypothetical protein
MLSSTSSSDQSDQVAPPSRARLAAIVLILGVTAFAATLEWGTRLFVYRLSNGLSRVHQEANNAEQMQRSPDGPRQVLLVGNSLVMADVDMSELNKALQPRRWQATRFAIEQTTYYDWHFGLRRLLASGSRPQAIVLCFEPRHLVASGVNTEFFGNFLLHPADLYEVSRTLGLNPTQTSDLFFANTSAFYALRKEIRKNLLARMFPTLPSLTQLITRGGLPALDLATLSSTGKERLRATQDVVMSADSRLVFLSMPPTSVDASAVLSTAGQDLGIPVITPLADDELVSADFDHDRYHLAERGRLRFTQRMIPLLTSALESPKAQRTSVARAPRSSM